MLISTMTMAFAEKYGYLEAVRRLSKLGFDCLDLTLTHFREKADDPLLSDDYKTIAEEIRKTADECGISFNQCHAPYYFAVEMSRIYSDNAMYEKIIGTTLRAIEVAGIVGAKTVVIHPTHFTNYNVSNRYETLSYNLNFYDKFAAAAKAAGVKIAVENMWQSNIYTKAIVADVCSNPYELKEYVDALNEKYGGGFTACLDIGHCALTGANPADAIKILGDRLGALHVHDNDARADQHLMPGCGVIDFTEVIKALKEVGYKGEFTYEADKYIKQHDVTEYEAAATRLYEKAKELINM